MTRIEDRTFGHCYNLEWVFIPDSITSIGDFAFEFSSLKKVYYKGSSNQWSSITIEGKNNQLISATIYYYSEVKPEQEGNFWRYDLDGNPLVW
jgi:hypothetical protein